MNVHNYKTAGGKDLIVSYIESLPKAEAVDGYSVIQAFKEDRTDEVKTSLWRGKISEVYFYKHNRIFYVIADGEDVFFLHACRKQKNKTEKKDADIVVNRAKEVGKLVSKNFI